METPIPIINNTHIELTRIVRFKGEEFFNKRYFFLGDIYSIEASRYGEGKVKCTKIEYEDGTTIKVTERYKAVRDTHLAYWAYVQSLSK